MTSIAGTSWLMNKAAVSDRFGRAAASYDQQAALQLSCARSLLDMAPAISGTFRALDLGCATAPLARAQQARWPDSRWLAVDLSPAMLMQAQQRGRTGSRMRPLCADAENLPLADASQDLVFSNFALQWCVPQRVAEEIGRVLMPEGKLLLAVPLAGSLAEMRASWAAAGSQRSRVNRLPTEKDWQKGLRDAGLLPLQWQVLRFTEHYPDIKTLVRAFKATGVDHVQDGVSSLTGKNAWRAMVTAYEARRESAGLPLTWQVLFVEAESQRIGTGDKDTHD